MWLHEGEDDLPTGIRCIVPYSGRPNKLGRMEHQQNDIQTSLLKTNQFYVSLPAPSSEGWRVVFLVGAALAFLGPGGTSTSPSRCVFRWFGMWVNLPKMAFRSDEFFWFWMAGCYQPPPLFIIKKWNMYIYIYYNFVECYRHVTNMWNFHLTLISKIVEDDETNDQ